MIQRDHAVLMFFADYERIWQFPPENAFFQRGLQSVGLTLYYGGRGNSVSKGVYMFGKGAFLFLGVGCRLAQDWKRQVLCEGGIWEQGDCQRIHGNRMKKLLLILLFVFAGTSHGADTTYFSQVTAVSMHSVAPVYDTLITITTKNYDSTVVCTTGTCYWTYKVEKDTVDSISLSSRDLGMFLNFSYSLFDSKDDSFDISVKIAAPETYDSCTSIFYDDLGPHCIYTVMDISANKFPDSAWHAPDSLWGDTKTRPGSNKKLYARFASSLFKFPDWDVTDSIDSNIVRLSAVRVGGFDTTYFYINPGTIGSQPSNAKYEIRKSIIKPEIAITQLSSTVTFSLPERTQSVSIYDIHGRIVTRLPVNGSIAVWHRTARGRYFAKVVSENRDLIKGFTVIE